MEGHSIARAINTARKEISEKLEEIRCGIIDVETEIEKLKKDDPVEWKIARLEVKPGEVLIVKLLDQLIGPEIVDGLRATFKKALPDSKIIVIDPGFNLSVISERDLNAKTETHKR